MTTILITGTNRGIGLELAKRALARGWRVFGSARKPVTAPDAQICDHSLFVDLQFDVTDHEVVRLAAERIDEPIDILVNNAGIIGPERQSTLDMDFEGFAHTIAVNTIAPLAVTQAFLPCLRRADNPRVVTLSSRMGSMSHASSGHIAYRASKAAVNKVMQGLAADLAGQGITAISIHPGWVQTDMSGPDAELSPAESAEGILNVADALTIEQTGQFLNWNGLAVDW